MKINCVDNIIRNKSYAFAIRIVNAYKFLTNDQHEYILSKQLLRSGTAIGALVRESEHAQSRADFINKLSIALKEANETEYWILLLRRTDYISQMEFDSIVQDCRAVVRILISIVRTSKLNING